jgi:Sulfotransferase family
VSTVLFIGGLGRSGSTLLERMLSRLDDVCSVGELVHLWERGLQENNRCGCGERFRDCAFWGKVGEVAFGGWDRLDVGEVLALKRSVDRNRFVPLMIAPALAPAYRARMRRYLELLERLYDAVREVSGRPLVVDASKHASHAFLVRRMRGVDLRLVHLVRDSRGVAFSWTKRMRRAEVVEGDALMATDTPLRMSARYLGYNLLFHLLKLTGVRRRARLRRRRLGRARPQPRPGRQPDALPQRPGPAPGRRGVARPAAPPAPPGDLGVDLAAAAGLRLPDPGGRPCPLSPWSASSSPPGTGRSCCAGP